VKADCAFQKLFSNCNNFAEDLSEFRRWSGTSGSKKLLFQSNKMKIRYPTAAGTFYPSQATELKNLIEQFLNQAKPPELEGKIKALIVPHAGYIYSGPVAAYAYKLLFQTKNQPEKVILLGPAHYLPINTASGSKTDKWQTPFGEINVLPPPSFIVIDDASHQPEHSLEVQLPFLQMTLKNFKILPVLINDENQSEELANLLFPLVDKKTLVIASSDLSHFYPYETAKKIDGLANKYIPDLEIGKTQKEVEACGLAAILTIMHLAKKLGWQGKFLKYQTSYEISGDKNSVVGYGAYVFHK